MKKQFCPTKKNRYYLKANPKKNYFFDMFLPERIFYCNL